VHGRYPGTHGLEFGGTQVILVVSVLIHPTTLITFQMANDGRIVQNSCHRKEDKYIFSKRTFSKKVQSKTNFLKKEGSGGPLALYQGSPQLFGKGGGLGGPLLL